MLMFAGQMGCEALNFALKRLIKEERPKQMYGKGYGMPSSHAQFVAYFSISLTLFLILRHTPPKRPIPSHTPLSMVTRVGLSILAMACAFLVAWSRIYLNYHTPKQVLVGYYGRCRQCSAMVPGYDDHQEIPGSRVGVGYPISASLQSQRPCRGGGSLPGWLGEMGRTEIAEQSESQTA